MSKTLTATAIFVVAIGFGIPALTLYYVVHYAFNSIIAGIIIFISIAAACVLGIVGMAISTEEIEHSGGLSSSEIEKLNMMRAHQRATLEEMDEIINLLKEIRDLLKSVGE
jgi:uncharacterized protein YlxW (UPF0749 family)